MTEAPDLALLNRREKRWTRFLAALTVVVALQAGALAYLVVLLQGRTPLIERIDLSEREARCVSIISLRFEIAIVATLSTPIDQREARVARLTAAGQSIEADLAAGVDPCLIELPNVATETPR